MRYTKSTPQQLLSRRPRVGGFKATQCGVEAIMKIRERELHRPEAMVGALSTLEPWVTPTSKPI